jgi:hypothetical protein
VFGDADAIAVGDFDDREAPIHRSLKIDMVRANPRRDGQLQLGRLGDPRGRQVGRPERLGDHDFRVWQFPFKNGVRAILVGGHDQRMAQPLDEFAQPEFPGNTTQKLPWREIDRLRAR